MKTLKYLIVCLLALGVAQLTAERTRDRGAGETTPTGTHERRHKIPKEEGFGCIVFDDVSLVASIPDDDAAKICDVCAQWWYNPDLTFTNEQPTNHQTKYSAAFNMCKPEVQKQAKEQAIEADKKAKAKADELASLVEYVKTNKKCPNDKKCDLSGVNLSNTDLSGANLSRATLIEATLSGANLSGASLSRANLTGADLSEAGLTKADLTRANLTKASLENATLDEAILENADLSGANLSGANLTAAYPRNANLEGTKFEGAKVNKIWQWAYGAGEALKLFNLLKDRGAICDDESECPFGTFNEPFFHKAGRKTQEWSHAATEKTGAWVSAAKGKSKRLWNQFLRKNPGIANFFNLPIDVSGTTAIDEGFH